jgi:hypothetical protein
VQERVSVAEGGDVEQVLGTCRRGPGDVGELHGGRDSPTRVEQRGEPVESIVGHPGDPDVRIDLAVMRRPRLIGGAGHQAEQRGLAGGRESDEACA